MRTSDNELVAAIKDISIGEASASTMRFLELHRRPLNVPDSRKLVLFGLRINAELHNLDCLQNQVGELTTYKAEDHGNQQQLRHLIVPKVSLSFLGVIYYFYSC